MPQQWDEDAFARTRRNRSKKADPRLVWLVAVLAVATVVVAAATWPADDTGESVSFEIAVHTWIGWWHMPHVRRF